MQTQRIELQEKFPKIKDVSITVVESSTGDPDINTYSFSKSGIPRFVKCHNSICDNDIGVSIENILYEMVKDNKTEHTVTKPCRGFEGSQHRNCLNKFKITIHIDL